MKIAIVSDTHDNLKNFLKVVDWLNGQKIKLILHCGDICNQSTIDEAEKKFKGEMLFVKGNGDYELSRKRDPADAGENYQDMMEVELGSKKAAFIHYPDLAKKLAESGKYDVVFYGHTHRPWEEKVGNSSTGLGRVCRLVNPGEVAGQRYKPTFALYDTEKDLLELKILEQLV